METTINGVRYEMPRLKGKRGRKIINAIIQAAGPLMDAAAVKGLMAGNPQPDILRRLDHDFIEWLIAQLAENTWVYPEPDVRLQLKHEEVQDKVWPPGEYTATFDFIVWGLKANFGPFFADMKAKLKKAKENSKSGQDGQTEDSGPSN